MEDLIQDLEQQDKGKTTFKDFISIAAALQAVAEIWRKSKGISKWKFRLMFYWALFQALIVVPMVGLAIVVHFILDKISWLIGFFAALFKMASIVVLINSKKYYDLWVSHQMKKL